MLKNACHGHVLVYNVCKTKRKLQSKGALLSVIKAIGVKHLCDFWPHLLFLFIHII